MKKEKQNKQRKQWFLKFPLIPAIFLAFIGLIAVSILTAVFEPLLTRAFSTLAEYPTETSNIASSVGRYVVALIAVLMMKKSSGGTFRFGLDGKNLGQCLKLSLFAAAYIAMTIVEGCLFAEGTRFDTVGLIHAVMLGLGAGIFEEILCRGIVASNMMDKWREKKGCLYLSVIVSGLAFGLIHLASLAENSVPYTLLQVFMASGIGILFGAIYLRTRNLLGLVIAHSLIDITIFLFVLPTEVVFKDYILIGFFGVYFTLAGLYLIRPAKHTEIKALWYGEQETAEQTEAVRSTVQ